MAAGMDALVAQVIGLSVNPVQPGGDLHQLHTYLKTQEVFLAAHTAAIPNALNSALDSSLHSLGVLYML